MAIRRDEREERIDELIKAAGALLDAWPWKAKVFDEWARLRAALAHPVSEAGFGHDIGAMRWADACVLLLPSGMSAHLEAGWFAGAGKRVVICAPEMREPELMYKCFDFRGETPIYGSVGEVIDFLALVAA